MVIDDPTDPPTDPPSGDPSNDPSADPPQDPPQDSDPAAPKDDLERLKREARKWEDRAKKNRDEAEQLRTQLAEYESANKTEQEKAIEAAARQAREEALSEAEKERRKDRLELAVTQVASVRGVKIDDKTVKFADPDDVQMWLERQIERGEVDADSIYKDGRVDDAALAEELARLAASKPGWLVGSTKGNGTPAGGADGGRGAPSAASSVERELAAIQRRRQPQT